MKKMWAVYVAVAAVLYLVGSTLYVAGAFKSITPNVAGPVTEVYTGIYGPEDMEVDESVGRLYISSANRWNTMRGLPAADAIWILDLDTTASPRRMANTYPGEFHPHGISLLKSSPADLLFVVNHNPSGNYVEEFIIHGDSLLHQRSYSDPSMCCPNDVVGIAPGVFYVTNDHGNAKGFGRTLEDYARLPQASLLYFDSKGFTTAYGGLRYANGVNINSDGSRVYVATTTGRNLLTFERDASTGTLRHLSTLGLKTGVDNIDVDADGNLWIAAHPKLLAFVGHAKDSLKKSPSQVLRLTPREGDVFQVDEIFMDDGTQLSGSSIAVRYKDQLLLGGVFQPRILRITLPAGKP